MIPAIFAGRAAAEVTPATTRATPAAGRRASGAVIGIAGAVGALGGAPHQPRVRQSSYTDGSGSGSPAFVAFLAFYAAVPGRDPGRVYLRHGPERTQRAPRTP